MILCGVNHANILNGLTLDAIFEVGIFTYGFSYGMDKKLEELEGQLKTYSTLTTAQQKIRVMPVANNNIKAITQWAHDDISMVIDPPLIPLPLL